MRPVHPGEVLREDFMIPARLSANRLAPPEEAAALHIRAHLAARLEHHIEQKGWNQTAAARALKVPQPTISKIINGNIERLSIEFLIKLMVRAGLPIGIAGGRIAIGRAASARRGAQHAPAAA